jgi:signal transduction histidine kinase
MSDIVWAVNPGRDGFRDLARRMRQFANEACVPTGVEAAFSAPEADEVRLGDELRRHVYLVFKEAVHNAVRHSGCGRLEVALEVGRDRLVLTVSDDGHGFDPSEEADGNGLVNMRKRAAALGAALDVRSGEGSGTTVTLSVPIHREGRFLRRRPD